MSVTESELVKGRRFFTIATAGHVDHGKTSLLRALTGIDPDRLKEEKERQMTTDLGFAYLSLSSSMTVGFVDVPGHGKFLKNMLAGVGGIDLALVVVAADEGPMPQTRQHVRILGLLGVSRALLAITKIDLADSEQVALVKAESRALLAEHGIEVADTVLVSNTRAEGFAELKESLTIILSDFPSRDLKGPCYLPVDRVFSKAGFGTVVTGTLVKGKLAVGDQVLIEPGKQQARVRRLETHGLTVNEAAPGQRVAVNLVLKDGLRLARGHVLSSSERPLSRIMIVGILDRPRLSSGTLSEKLCDQPLRMYHGTAEYHGNLRWVEDLSNPSTRESSNGIGFIALSEPAVVAAQDRFLLRLGDDTIFGGIVLLRDRPPWLTKRELLEISQLLQRSEFVAALTKYLDGSPQLMVREATLTSLLPPDSIKDIVDSGIAKGQLCRLGEFLLSSPSRQVLSEKICAKLGNLMEVAGANEDGVQLETLRQHLQPKLERTAFHALLEEEGLRKTLVRKADRVRLPGAVSRKVIAPELLQLEAKVQTVLDEHWCMEWEELSESVNANLKDLKVIVAELVKSGSVLVASYDFVASRKKVREAHEILSEIWTKKRSIAPTDLREQLGTTRKYAMALLQYFDDQKITRRLDSGRVLLKAPGKE